MKKIILTIVIVLITILLLMVANILIYTFGLKGTTY